MASHRPGRREFMTAAGAGVVTAGLAGTASAAPAPAGASGSGVTGGWYITRTNTGAPVSARSVITFAEGGAFVGMDINPMSPTYLGSWAAEGPDSVTAVFWFVVTDEKGRQVGTARVKLTARVSGDTIAGSYTGVIFAQGSRQNGTGVFHGRRINQD